MSTIDPQIMQQIVQFLATYGAPAGIAAAQAVGTGATQVVGDSATKAVKNLWAKIRHKSEQEGSIVEATVTAFENAPDEPEHQQTLTFILKQLCTQDPSFAHDIAQLFDEVKRDSVAGRFIQHISRNAQVGVAGVNYGYVNIHNATQSKEVLWQNELVAILNHFELTWKITYRKDMLKLIEPSLSALQAKIISTSDKLIYLISQNSRVIPKELISKISDIAAQLENLGRWGFSIDGGESVKEFNELGDKIERDAANIRGQISGIIE